LEAIVVNNIDELDEACEGRTVSVYGAKTIAIRLCYFLESRGETVKEFVVSNQYENPIMLRGKPVKRIEENRESYDCMVLAARLTGGIQW
jgi:hypothetical protein